MKRQILLSVGKSFGKIFHLEYSNLNGYLAENESFLKLMYLKYFCFKEC